MEPALAHPPLPKLAWIAAAIALVSAAYLISTTLFAQTFVALPLAVIPLLAGVGILRRNIWSARGFALYQVCGIVAVLFLGLRSTLTPAEWATLIGAAFFTLLIATLFFVAARSLARAQGKRGRPHLWIAASVLVLFPWFFVRAFSIPSASMEDTLLVGDYVLVQHWPKPVVVRADTIVFPYPLNPDEDHIKRVVGVAGDRIRITNKILYRNGAPVTDRTPFTRRVTLTLTGTTFPASPTSLSSRLPKRCSLRT